MPAARPPARMAFIKASKSFLGTKTKVKKRIATPNVGTETKVKKRIATPNIPEKPVRRVSMESKLPGERRTNEADWPETARYESIGNTVAGEGLPETVKMALKEGLKKKNQICCSCGPGVDCSTNSSCSCNQMAQSMAAKFTNKLRLLYGKSVPVINKDFDFWSEIFFCCGDNCTCSSCKMNALRDLSEENFKALRTDARGFCVYTKLAIKKGHPVVSFNGELVGYDTVNDSELVLQYALRIIDKDKAFTKWVKKAPHLSNSYKELVQNAFMKEVWINPLSKGNCSRFLSHSCKPNVSMRRIFQGGISPANMRIVMFADRDIQPGEEVTFDYGELYKKAHLLDCLCTHCDQIKKEKQKLRQMRSSRSVESQSSSSSGSVIPPTAQKPTVHFNLNRVKIEEPSQEREIPERPHYNFRHTIKQEIVSDDEDDDDDVQVLPVQPSRHRQGSVAAGRRLRVIKIEEPDDYEEYQPPSYRRSSSRRPANTGTSSPPVASTHAMVLRHRQPSVHNTRPMRVAASVPPRNTARSGSVSVLRHTQEEPVRRRRQNAALPRVSPYPERNRNSNRQHVSRANRRSVPSSDRLLRSQSQDIC